MLLIKEVFWLLDSDKTKQSELENKPLLGIKSFAVKVDPNWVEIDLKHDFKFLRDKILAHQYGSYASYTGPKVRAYTGACLGCMILSLTLIL